ncbi:MAG: hypothetical protein CMJ50_02855 [Planctomycetaceae bacterium]|nr:hypothetical protein [Planctomycetaceae bacterium]
MPQKIVHDAAIAIMVDPHNRLVLFTAVEDGCQNLTTFGDLRRTNQFVGRLPKRCDAPRDRMMFLDGHAQVTGLIRSCAAAPSTSDHSPVLTAPS